MWRMFVVFLLCSNVLLGQSNSNDSSTLSELLTEVRQLRQDLRTISTATQRYQLLIVRLQQQEVAVEQASRHLDGLRETLAKVKEQRRQAATDVKQNEDIINASSTDSASKQALQITTKELAARLV